MAKIEPYTDKTKKLLALYAQTQKRISDALDIDDYPYDDIDGEEPDETQTETEAAVNRKLKRVRAILTAFLVAAWRDIPDAVNSQYLQGIAFAAKAAKAARPSETGHKSSASGFNSGAGTYSPYVPSVTEQLVVDRVSRQLMATTAETADTVVFNLQNAWDEAVETARLNETVNPYVSALVKAESKSELTGGGLTHAKSAFMRELRERGIVGFTDKAGREWQLDTYADMATRTAARQATNLGTLCADPEQDLYIMSAHEPTCEICAPLQGRVYSRSGTDPRFPPLALAFGLIDQSGAATLDNSYLTIHPNCLHTLSPWTPAGRTEEEIEKTVKESSFESNPPTIDPRTEAQIEAYHKKTLARERFISSVKQWRKYRDRVGEKIPSLQTFLKHKEAGDERYKYYQSLYRKS